MFLHMERSLLLRPWGLRFFLDRSIVCGQAGADQFPVIAGKDVFVGVGGMRPADAAPLVQLVGCRLNQFRAADLVKALGRKRADDQFARAR